MHLIHKLFINVINCEAFVHHGSIWFVALNSGWFRWKVMWLVMFCVITVYKEKDRDAPVLQF